MFDKIYDAIVYVLVTPTMDELDEASSFLSSGRLPLDSDRSFGVSVEFSDRTSPFLSTGRLSLDLGRSFVLVRIGGFIFLLILNGLAISRISSCFFYLFSLSIFWISTGYLILFSLW